MNTKQIDIKRLQHFFILFTVYFSLSACGGSGESGGQTNLISPVPAPIPNPSPVVNSVVAVEDLTTGACVDVIDSTNGVEFFRIIACNQAHQYEKAGTYELSDFGAQFPGSLAIDRVIHKGCRAVYEEHMGQAYTGKDFGIQPIAPSRSTWDNGDRTVVCLLMNIDRSMLTRSLAS